MNEHEFQTVRCMIAAGFLSIDTSDCTTKREIAKRNVYDVAMEQAL